MSGWLKGHGWRRLLPIAWRFLEGASILGLTVVGAMIPAVINYKLDLTYKVGKVTMNVQDMLDKIMPALIPLAIALFSYWILGRKHIDSTRLIFV